MNWCKCCITCFQIPIMYIYNFMYATYLICILKKCFGNKNMKINWKYKDQSFLKSFRPRFNELPYFPQISQVLVLSIFGSQYFFTNDHTFFLFNIHSQRAPMFLQFDLYRVWYSIVFPTCWLHLFKDHWTAPLFVIGKRHVVAGKETL